MALLAGGTEETGRRGHKEAPTEKTALQEGGRAADASYSDDSHGHPQRLPEVLNTP